MKGGAIIIAICGCLFLSAGCKKEPNDSPGGKILRDGRWQIAASDVTVKYMGRDTTIDQYRNWEPCEQDDYMEFDKKGKGASYENSNKCPDDNEKDSFTWELQDNDTKLKLKLADGRTIVLDIVELNSGLLKLGSQETSGGQTGWLVETYKNMR